MAQTKDLTQGDIRSQLIALALPLLAGNILQQLYNTIDAVIVGQFVGESAFAAVGVAGSVMNLFLFLISGGCAGVGVLLAQFHGAGDGSMFRRDCWLSTCFGGLAALGLTLAGLLTLENLLVLLRTPQDVLPHARDYLRVIFLGFPIAFAFRQGAAVLRAVGNTRAALVFLMVSMGAPVIGATGHISFRALASFLLAPALGLPAVALATGLGWIGVVVFWTILARRCQ